MNKWRVQDPVYEADELNPSLDVSPWAGHRGFAYDLMTWRRPALVVELGTHYGCSFFAFTQAAKDHQLGGRIVAVDTWEGDPHAGEYGEEVIAVVRQTLEERFPDVQSELLRKTFQQALKYIEDESVDLLHIDGFHSYEAVQQDYETWLPKLAPDGIVLFHDVAGDNGYESPLFWAEVREQHPFIEFPHSFGLGVLFPKGGRWYDELQKAGLLPWLQLYRWRADARLAQRQLHDTAEQLEQRWKVVQSLEEMVRARDEAQAAQATLLDERLGVMQSLEEMIRGRDEAIAAQATLLEERWALLTATEERLASVEMEVVALARVKQQIAELQGQDHRSVGPAVVLRRAGAQLVARLPLRRPPS